MSLEAPRALARRQADLDGASLEIGLDRDGIVRSECGIVRRAEPARHPSPVKGHEAGARADLVCNTCLCPDRASAGAHVHHVFVFDPTPHRIDGVNLHEWFTRAFQQAFRLTGARHRVPLVSNAAGSQEKGGWYRLRQRKLSNGVASALLIAPQDAARHAHLVDLVWAVVNAGSALVAIPVCDGRVVAHSQAAERL